jgi:hypothetical protein
MLRKMRQEAKRVGPPRARERYELFEVSESELFDGVWMPTKFIEFSWASGMSFGNLRETIAGNIKLGSVKKEDLEIAFPAGTVVDDRITGDRWTVGKEKTPGASPPPERAESGKARVPPPDEKTAPAASKPETGQKQGTKWTPENIKKDPAGLRFAG